MKNTIALIFGVALAGCNNDTAPDAGTTTPPAAVTAVSTHNPDPRVATILEQHEQLLALQKEYTAQLGSLKGHEKLSPAHIKDSQQRFADFVQQSEANLLVLDQLNVDRSQEPAQLALVGELATKESSILERAKRRV